MVKAFHVIFSTYGFWLPNDPRGSWSKFTSVWELYRFGGKATKTDSRRSLANEPHDREKRIETKEYLKYPPVVFDGYQARAVGRGFAQLSHPVFACSIMPEHVHMVIGRTELSIEKTVVQYKQYATVRLQEEGYVFPRSPWARGMWKVFLNEPEQIGHAIRYVEENPVKEGKPPQKWTFVMPYTSDYD